MKLNQLHEFLNEEMCDIEQVKYRVCDSLKQKPIV